MRTEPAASASDAFQVPESASQVTPGPGNAERLRISDPAAYPLITLCIPTRNRASLLRSAVERALAQSYANIEVLVSDNCSTDDTLIQLRSIEDPRLRVLTSSQDIGHGANCLKCIRAAKGAYLLILPDDDWISDTFLEKCVRLIRAEPGVQAVVAAYGVFFADENRDRPAILSKRLSTGVWNGSEILKEFLRSRLSAITLSMVVSTKFLRQDGVWPMEYQSANDILALARTLLSGRVGLVNERCATLRIHNSTVSNHLGLDHSFTEIRRVMQVISDSATSSIADHIERRAIQNLTARYVAKKLFDFLILYRRQGASLVEVAQQWQIWRKQSRQCRLAHFVTALRLRTFPLLLLPSSATDLALAFRHATKGRGALPAA
jgi:glycosyltransferase involved in cell wall biosynthesis